MSVNEQGWIERFEAFARSKPADETYNAGNADTCALAQFGYPGAQADNLNSLGVPRAAFVAALGNTFGDNTFGALADRLAAIVEPGK